jgi:uncharacterized protein YdgA (DUF945 family)
VNSASLYLRPDDEDDGVPSEDPKVEAARVRIGRMLAASLLDHAASELTIESLKLEGPLDSETTDAIIVAIQHKLNAAAIKLRNPRS